jgi:hypothetical protein
MKIQWSAVVPGSSNDEDVHENLNEPETIILGKQNRKNSTICNECVKKTSSEHDSTATMETESSSMGINVKQPLVHFCQDDPPLIGYVSLSKDLEPSQRDALWWSANDYEVFAETAKSISKEVRKHHALTTGIDEAYRRAGEVATELQDEQDVFDAMKRLPLDSVRLLTTLPACILAEHVDAFTSGIGFSVDSCHYYFTVY